MDSIKELDTYDLIDEIGQLQAIVAHIDARRVHSDDPILNHCLLDSAVSRLVGSVAHAHYTFKKSVYSRQSEVLRELSRRGIVDVEFGGQS